MRISVLTIGAIASILSINSVFATTSTVTSKDYVDAADSEIYDYVNEELANKQDLIETERDGNWSYDYPDWEPEVKIVTTDPNDDEQIVGNEYGIVSRDNLFVFDYANTGDAIVAIRNLMAAEESSSARERTVLNTQAVGAVLQALDYKITNSAMTCAGWPDGVQHTDANCWLWNKN